MKVTLLVSMGTEVGFNQRLSINGINFKIFYKCCRKHEFKDLADVDSEGLASSLNTLEDSMLLLPMTCYYSIKSVMMLGTQTGDAAKFIRNKLLQPSIREEEPGFNHIRLCSPVQSKLDSCFGDNQYILCAFNRDETALELFFHIIEAMLITSLSEIGITLMFINLLVNIQDSFGKLETMQAQPRTSWSGRYFYFWHCGDEGNEQFKSTERQGGLISTHKMTLGMTQIFSFYITVFIFVCLIYWCDEEYNFWSTAFYQQKKNDWKMKLWRLQKVHSNWFVSILNGSKMKQKDKSLHVLMTVFIHLHCSMPKVWK